MMTERQITASIQDLAPMIKQKLDASGTVEFTAPGRSMRPTLLDRVSRVRIVKAERPKCGDMVYYRRDDGTYIIHRIVACCPDGTYTICGDGQFVKEPGVREEQIIGVVSAFTRHRGWIDCDNCLYRFCIFFLPLLRLLRHAKASIAYRIRKLKAKIVR